MSYRKCSDVVTSYECPVVELTGGEPLLQKDVYPLMTALLDAGHTVLIETGGHVSLAQVPPGVIKIVDVKCPGSGEAHRMDWDNLSRLSAHDEVKFVIRDREDYDYAREVVARYRWTIDAPRCSSRRCTACSLRGSWLNGCSRIACPSACSCRFTSTSGMHRRAASSETPLVEWRRGHMGAT